MHFTTTPFPAFSWSWSRHRMLAECPRRYFYTYYLAHNGWLPTASARSRLAYVLKHLVTLPMALGIMLHERARELVRAVLAREALPDVEELWTRTRQALRHACAPVEPARFAAHPKEQSMLLERYYDGALSRATLEAVGERARRALRVLHESALWAELGACPEADVRLPEAPTSFDFGGTTVWVVPDLVYRSEAGWTVLDWKAGRGEGAEAQVALYGAALEHGAGLIGPDDLAYGRVVRLQDDADETMPIPPADREMALGIVRESVAAMGGRMRDPGINAPYEQAAYERTQCWSTCARCPFLELCASELGLEELRPPGAWPLLSAAAREEARCRP
ncbi:MAG TPA: PD-(D/E)XK nuclease family protein [Gemmatimonadales bacterium]|nr:PD-(D/E)XK nuclease family protein [Gemmatimonadales bacterium]